MVDSAVGQPAPADVEPLQPSPAPPSRSQQPRQDTSRERPSAAPPYEPARAAPPAARPRAEPRQPRPQAPRADRDAATAAPAGPLDAGWNDVLRSLGRQKGRRFNLGALLRSSTVREIVDGEIVVQYAHASHLERIEEELDDPQTRRLVEEAFEQVLGQSYKIRVSGADASNGGTRPNPVQSSHLVRAAMAMGAQCRRRQGGPE